MTQVTAAQANIAEANKAWTQRYLEEVSGQAKNEALIRKFTTDEALVEHVRIFEPAFPRYELLADEMIAEGDKVVIRGRGRGKHEGEFAGIAPTGREIEFPVIVIYQLANEKIVKFWVQADMMSLMQQLTAES